MKRPKADSERILKLTPMGDTNFTLLAIRTCTYCVIFIFYLIFNFNVFISVLDTEFFCLVGWFV